MRTGKVLLLHRIVGFGRGIRHGVRLLVGSIHQPGPDPQLAGERAVSSCGMGLLLGRIGVAANGAIRWREGGGGSAADRKGRRHGRRGRIRANRSGRPTPPCHVPGAPGAFPRRKLPGRIQAPRRQFRTRRALRPSQPRIPLTSRTSTSSKPRAQGTAPPSTTCCDARGRISAAMPSTIVSSTTSKTPCRRA